jgi:hypothetical protein
MMFWQHSDNGLESICQMGPDGGEKADCVDDIHKHRNISKRSDNIFDWFCCSDQINTFNAKSKSMDPDFHKSPKDFEKESLSSHQDELTKYYATASEKKKGGNFSVFQWLSHLHGPTASRPHAQPTRFFFRALPKWTPTEQNQLEHAVLGTARSENIDPSELGVIIKSSRSQNCRKTNFDSSRFTPDSTYTSKVTLVRSYLY